MAGQANMDQGGDVTPPSSDLRTAEFLGRRVAEVAQELSRRPRDAQAPCEPRCLRRCRQSGSGRPRRDGTGTLSSRYWTGHRLKIDAASFSRPVSKHAVEGLIKSVALEIGKAGIRVNVVAPRPTAGTPENKGCAGDDCSVGPPRPLEELANAIVFIASDESFIHHGSCPQRRRW